MANPEHLAILKQGVEVWNRWRKDHPEVRPTLSDVDLFHSDLPGIAFHEADLSRADLSVCGLQAANLQKAVLTSALCGLADLRDADLRGADLSGTVFSEALLNGAKLDGCRLTGTHFSWCDMEDTTIYNAEIAFCTFSGIDFRRIRGLDNILHRAKSSIGMDCIVASKAQIPPKFLRGTGLPDEVIEYASTNLIVGGPFRSCFISYSSLDQRFADRLFADLQAKGVRCWFAPHHVKGGHKLSDQITAAIRAYDRLLLILSEHSMSSDWVRTEVANAREREVHEKRQMLFPITLVPFERIKEWAAFDSDTGKDSAREIREYFIPDFSNWKDHDSYQSAFERLLRDLKAE